MGKRKIKKSFKIFVVAFLFTIFLLIFSINKIREENSIDYKLRKIGYSTTDITILKKMNEDELNKILNTKYNDKIVNLMQNKFFIFKNLDKYLEMINKDKKSSIELIIALINTNRDSKDYDNIKNADISLNEKMLVNKYYKLNDDYVPKNLVSIESSYAFEGNFLVQEAYDAYLNMWDAAKKDKVQLIVKNSYRSYKESEEIWQDHKREFGTKSADEVCARAGHSDHNTGYGMDLDIWNEKEEFEKTEGFKWLNNNAYKYGFILRYPKDKKNITGYEYEPWHYRYVGNDIAKKIKDLNITFDEYYAYYIEK